MFDYDAARREGYTDQEIAEHLSERGGFNYPGASAEGYSDKEIVDHILSTENKELYEALETPEKVDSSFGLTPIGKQESTLGRGIFGTPAPAPAAKPQRLETPSPDEFSPTTPESDYTLTPLGDKVDTRTSRTFAEDQQRKEFLATLPSHVKQSAIESTGGVLRSFGETDIVNLMGNLAKKINPAFRFTEMAIDKLGVEVPVVRPIAHEWATKKGKELADRAGLTKEQLLKEVSNLAPISKEQELLLGVVESLGIAAPGMLLGPVAGPVPMLAMFGFSEYGRSYQEARESGKTPEESRGFAAMNAAIEVGTEYIPAVRMFAKGTPGFNRLVGVFTSEMGGESAATIGQNINSYVTEVGKDLSPEEFLTKMWEDLKTTWVTTAIVAPIQSGVSHAGIKTIEKIKSMRAQPAKTPEDILRSGSLDEALSNFDQSLVAPTGVPLPQIDDNLESAMAKFEYEHQPTVQPEAQTGILAQPEERRAIPEDRRTIPERLTEAVGKPTEMDTLAQMGITDEKAQIEQIVVDAVTQLENAAIMAKNGGRDEMAAKLHARAVENGEKLKAAGGEFTAKTVDAAIVDIEAIKPPTPEPVPPPPPVPPKRGTFKAIYNKAVDDVVAEVEAMGSPTPAPEPQPVQRITGIPSKEARQIEKPVAEVVKKVKKEAPAPSDKAVEKIVEKVEPTIEQVTDKGSVAHGQEVDVAPTEAQKGAENYKKAHVRLDGMDITIENPAGSTRSGKDASGKEWSIKLKNDYGYIKGSKGYDKDHVDVFFAKGYKGDAKTVHVVNQHNADGSFDEHKAVVGAKNDMDAMALYNANYEKGWTGGKSVVEMPMDDFKVWVKSGEPKKGAIKPKDKGPGTKTAPEQPEVTVVRANGQPFKTKASLKASAKQRHIPLDTFSVIEKDGGFVGVDNIENRKAIAQERYDNVVEIAKKEKPATGDQLLNILRGDDSAYKDFPNHKRLTQFLSDVELLGMERKGAGKRIIEQVVEVRPTKAKPTDKPEQEKPTAKQPKPTEEKGAKGKVPPPKKEKPKKKTKKEGKTKKQQEGLQNIISRNPHRDEAAMEAIGEDIINEDVAILVRSDTPALVESMIGDMIDEDIVESRIHTDYLVEMARKGTRENAESLIETITTKKTADLKGEDLSELKEKLADDEYMAVREWLLKSGDIKRTVESSINEEIAKEKESLEPNLVSEHEEYRLFESKAGIQPRIVLKGKVAPFGFNDRIHIVRMDESAGAAGAKKQKVARVQKVVGEAISRLPKTQEQIKAVRFVLPDGTEFTIINDKKALLAFKKIINKVYTPLRSKLTKKGKKPTKVKPTKKAERVYWGDTLHEIEGNDDWVSDGHILIKGYRPKITNKIDTGVPALDEITLHNILVQADTNANPAEVRYYSTTAQGFDVGASGVSKKPILNLDESIHGSRVVVMDKVTKKRYAYNQGYLNTIKATYPDAEYSVTPEGSLYAIENGEVVAVVMPFITEQGIPNADMAKGSGLYSMGNFADIPTIMELPEVVELATELMQGKRPRLVQRFRKEGVRGMFRPVGNGHIDILQALGSDQHQGLKTISHEIGHLVDYLDEKTMKRGNILGKIKGMGQHLKHFMAPRPGAKGVLTKDDKNRLMREARLLAKRNASKLIDETITEELEVTPDDVLAVLKGVEVDPEVSAEIVSFIFNASTTVKKSLGKQAMKGMSPKEMDHLRSYVETKTGKKVAQPDATGKDIYANFKDLVKKEIAKRRLLSKEIIEDELKALTRVWRPFDPWANTKYTAYRHSAAELYADALSAIITSPATVKRMAPTFWDGFFAYVDNKPMASKTWGDILERIGRGPREVSLNRIESDYEMFARGHAARARRAERKPERGFFNTLELWLDDKNHFINKELRSLEKEGGQTAIDARDAINQLHELPYIASEVDDFLYEFNKRVQQPMDEAGITIDDLGVIAARKHIAANRQDVFSTKGYNQKTATADLEVLKGEIGEDEYNLRSDLIDEIRKIRDERIYPLMQESGLYTPELAKFMNETTDYTKVSVINYLEEEFGAGTGGRIFQQLGTLADIENPIVATIVQDISILRAARINESKRSVVPLLAEAGAIEPAKLTYDQNIKKRVPKKPRGQELDILTVMIGGKPQHYYAPKTIVDAYKYTPVEAEKVTRVWQHLTSATRQMLISKNPVWMARNPFRDFRDTLKKNPEIKLRHSPRLLKLYSTSLVEVFNEARKIERSKTISHLMRSRALTEDRVYDGMDLSTTDELLRLQNSFALPTNTDAEVGKFRRVFNYLNRQADVTGRAMEIVSKVAGYKYLKKYTDMDDKAILNRVRGGRIGTPDFKTRGQFHSFTNNLFMFSNIGKEGIKTHIKAARENPGDYIWKTIATNIMPKMMLAMAAHGLLNHLFDEDEDEMRMSKTVTDMVSGPKMQRIVAGIPEYDLAHYTIIPLALTEKDNAFGVRPGMSVYLRIPEDYEGQAIGAIAWKIFNNNLTGMGSAVSEMKEMQPYNLHPVAGAIGDLVEYYGSGINPVDDYRGRKILSEKAMAAGGLVATKEMTKHVWRSVGGRTFYDPKYDDVERDRSFVEETLSSFPGNVIGTFIKVTDRGLSEKFFSEFREIDKRKTVESMKIDKEIAKMSLREKLIVAEAIPKLKRRIQKRILQKEDTAYTRALAAANTKEKIAIVISAMEADMNNKKD